MLGNLFGSVTDFGLGLAGGAISNLWNRKNSKKDFKRQVQIMQMQNEYNKPVNQVARLREAGLSKHLVAGGASGMSAGSTASFGSHTSGVDVDMSNVYSQYLNNSNRRLMAEGMDLDNLNKQKTSDLIEAQIRETNARTRNINELTRREQNNNDINEYNGTTSNSTFWDRLIGGGLKKGIEAFNMFTSGKPMHFNAKREDIKNMRKIDKYLYNKGVSREKRLSIYKKYYNY